MRKHGIFIVMMMVGLLISTIAVSQDQYLPLDPGKSEIYANTANPYYRIHRYITAVGPSAIYHSDVLVGDIVSESLALRLASDTDGSIYCQGGCWCPGQEPCHLTPGDLMVPATLKAGTGWETWCESDVHGLVVFAYTCVRSEMVTVPAGTFECYLVARQIKSSTWKYRSLEWYSEGVGLVKFYWPWAGTYELIEMTNEVQPHQEKAIETDTWGGVKALYR